MWSRWKMQLSYGLIWSVVMTVLTIGMDAKEKGFFEQFLESGTWIRFGINFVLGTFFLGYFAWRSARQRKKEDEIKRQD